MTERLGYKHDEPTRGGQSNQRNGTSGEAVLTDGSLVDSGCRAILRAAMSC